MATSVNIETEAIKRHLGDVEAIGNFQIFSGFRQGLNEARTVTGRNEKGEIVNDEKPLKPWLGALGYMALLDQIGTCFKQKGVADDFGDVKKFKAALYRFGKFEASDDKGKIIDALYALRCSFAHDFALLNCTPAGKYNYRFSVVWETEGKMVSLPIQDWDKGFSPGHHYPERMTIVNLKLFVDFVEDICSTLFELADKDELEICFSPDGAAELTGRYLYNSLRKK